MPLHKRSMLGFFGVPPHPPQSLESSGSTEIPRKIWMTKNL